jgi:prefoldin subunit 5
VSADAQLALTGWVTLGVMISGILVSVGASLAQIGSLKKAVAAIHRRIDEIEVAHQEVREHLIANGTIELGTSPGRRNPLLGKQPPD